MSLWHKKAVVSNLSILDLISNLEIRAGVINGQNVKMNEYPWQVRLSIPGKKAFCGGSLLTRDHILTAAHCITTPAQDITVWTRDHDFTRADGEESHAVCNLTKHPEYGKKRSFDADIAVLHLCKPLMFTK